MAGVAVGVAGASGYAGGELLRLLTQHPRFDVTAVAGHSQVGQFLGNVHPNLQALRAVPVRPAEPETFQDCELVFLALPHGESAALAGGLAQSTKVVDLGADFRLAEATQWERFYGRPHAGTWTYGLPELPGAREAISQSWRVANPGCYATAILLALYPLVRAGLIAAQDVVVVAASGTSGAGRSPSQGLLASEVMGSMSAYKVGGVHQHTPEIEQLLGEAAAGLPVSLSFTPLLAPMPRGIVATSTAPLAANAGVSMDDVRSCFNLAYANETFVHLLATDQWPRTADVLGSNSAILQVAIDEHVQRVVVVSALDNLGKGAAGQALQNANLMCGFPEGWGLSADGVAP
ncbi:MAG: N-acetyl-gamma-glutamyl-phosphate reductase [Actinomycetales bacterium]